MENKYLLYIGKTNKKFTHNIVYNYFCHGKLVGNSNIIIQTNEGCLINFNNNPKNRKKKRYLEKKIDYFLKNFKIIDDIEYLRYCRKQKLLKISKLKNI